MFSTFRYGYWRYRDHGQVSSSIPARRGAGSTPSSSALLLLAETYAFVILFLGYLQTLWPLRRTPVPLPDDTEAWPAVDLLIPTYNEPLSVVKLHRAGRDEHRLARRQAQRLHPRRRQARRVPQVRRRGRHRLHDARRQRARQGRQHQSRARPAGLALRRHLRLRPRPHAQLPADDHGLVPARQQAGDAADAAPLLFARSVRAQSRPVPHHPQRRRAASTASCRTATTSGTRPSSAAPAPCCAAPRSTRSAASPSRPSPKTPTPRCACR